MGVAVFDYGAWAGRYRALALNVDEALASAYFAEAGLLYLNNTDDSVVDDVPTRLVLLNMLVAHIAVLNGAFDPAGEAAPVGRVSSGSEGSISASFDYTSTPGTEQWYLQTQYGATYWLATAPYRLFSYVPGDQPVFDIGYGMGGQGSGLWGLPRWQP
jgi:hypothetical protein